MEVEVVMVVQKVVHSKVPQEHHLSEEELLAVRVDLVLF